MTRLCLAAIAAAGLHSLAACGSRTAAGCTSDEQCPGGYVCLDSSCSFVCDADNDCPADKVCRDAACVPGERTTPRIDTVDGASAERCVDTTGTDIGHCLGVGFVVSGQNLASATWRLIGDTSYDLLTVSESPTRVELAVAEAEAPRVREGSYRLSVRNQSGGDEAGVSLLRGEKGEKGDPGTPGTSGTGTATAAQTFLYVDSGSSPTASAIVHNRLVVRASAPTSETAAPKTVPVDDAKLLELCGDDDGCDVSLGMTGWVDSTGFTVKAQRTPGACRFFIKKDASNNRHWSVDTGCWRWFATWPADGVWSNAPDFKPGFFTPYMSWQYGVDGPGGPAGDTGNVLMLQGGGCVFSETVPPATITAPGQLEPDTTAGFYLIATTPAWDYPVSDATNRGTYYPYPRTGAGAPWPIEAAGRTCELTFAD